jgi:hypothetical protein
VKHRDVLIVMMLACACGSRGDKPAPVSPVFEAVREAAARTPRRAVDPIAKGVPHSGVIRELAATEEGDAAITSDELEQIRLWPSLDGSRTPVPIALSSPAQRLALFHDGSDLVAVVLDTAGAVTLVHLGLDGSVRSRSQLPGDASYVEVIPVGNQVLARTNDHAIELFSSSAERLGRIMPGHGERVTDIAARRGRAAAVIATDDGAAFIRWISAGVDLRWEVSMKLPQVPRDNMLAIAPGKRRIAFIDTGNTGVHVLDLELIPLPLKGPALSVGESHTAIGFVDDDTAVIAGAPSMWWTRDPEAPTGQPQDPWAVTTPPHTAPGLGTVGAAIVDRYLIQPSNLSLALMDSTSTRYLGWKDSASNSSLQPSSQTIVMTTSSSQFTWLDDNLAFARAFNLLEHRKPQEPWLYGTPLGTRHVLAQHGDEQGAVLELIDTDKPDARVLVGKFARYDRHEYMDGMLDVWFGRTVRRFQVDLEASRVTELRPALKLPTESVSWIRLFDPAKANGLVGVAVGWETEYSGHQTAWVFRMDGTKVRTTKVKSFDYTLIKSDPNGAMYMFDGTGPALVVMRGDKVESRTVIPDLSFPMAINADATRIVTKNDQDIVMRDAKGAELWRTSIWNAAQMTFIAGGKRLVVSAPGGLVSFDAEVGRQLARECAWSFGLHDTPSTAMPTNIATVCEDDGVRRSSPAMSRPLVAALAIATLSCGQPAKPVTPVKPKRIAEGSAAPAGPETPPSTVHRSRKAVEAPHAGTIVALTATPDATAVLTIDELGGARLWPTLDGTKEPRVVELPAARELSLGPIPGGYTAVVLDESGGLYIAKLDGDGRTLAHTTHGIDPAYAGMAMSTLGTIAWRVDHHVLRIDADGTIKDQLGTEPQQRIVDISVAGERAIALIENAGKTQARWLTLSPKLAWGEWLAPLADGLIGKSIALAPDVKHVALTVQADKLQKVLILDDKGKSITTQEFPSNASEMRFADANLLALGGQNGLSWLTISTTTIAGPTSPVFTPQVRQRELLAAGNGRAILPSNGELMFVTPSETTFLGYQTLAPRLAQVGPDGGVMLNMNNAFHLLDKDLKITGKPWLARAGASPSELQWLGGDDWLVESAGSDGKSELALVDASKSSSVVVRAGLVEAHVLAFEPSTDLATLSFGSSAEVARLDRKGRTLDRVASVAASSTFEQTVFVPLAPKLARGNQLLAVSLRDKAAIKWLADARHLDKPAAKLDLDGAYAAADAAGHLYAWRNAGSKAQMTIYTDGKQTGTLPIEGAATLWPNATGTQVLVLGQAGVTLYGADGTSLWTRDLGGAQDALWLTDGAIAITHASGIARLDPKTGQLAGARCGWEFGISTKPHPIAPRIEPVCMQLLR